MFQIFIENDYQFIINKKTSEIYNLVSSETNRFCNGLIRSVFELFSKFFVFSLMIIGLLIYNFKITSLSILAGGLLYLIIYNIFRRYVSKFNKNIDNITTKDNNFLRTGTNAILELRIFSIAKNFLFSYEKNLLKKHKYSLILVQCLTSQYYKLTNNIYIILINVRKKRNISSWIDSI